jgi:hypothetical protein
MRLKILFSLVLFTTMSGCATGRLRLLERADLIRTDFVDGTDNVYVVRMNEIQTLGWDARERKVREETLHEMFRSSCKKIFLVEDNRYEEPLTSGNGIIAFWVLTVRCEK